MTGNSEKAVQVQAGDAYTFVLKGPPYDEAAQAATLLAASEAGIPFCEE